MKELGGPPSMQAYRKGSAPYTFVWKRLSHKTLSLKEKGKRRELTYIKCLLPASPKVLAF